MVLPGHFFHFSLCVLMTYQNTRQSVNHTQTTLENFIRTNCGGRIRQVRLTNAAEFSGDTFEVLTGFATVWMVIRVGCVARCRSC